MIGNYVAAVAGVLFGAGPGLLAYPTLQGLIRSLYHTGGEPFEWVGVLSTVAVLLVCAGLGLAFAVAVLTTGGE